MSATATAVERTGPIGTLILITDDEMRDILTHIAGAGDRWMSLRYSSGLPRGRGRVVSARHTTDLGLDLPLTLEGTDR